MRSDLKLLERQICQRLPMRVVGQRRDVSIPTLFQLSGTALSTSTERGPHMSPVLRALLWRLDIY